MTPDTHPPANNGPRRDDLNSTVAKSRGSQTSRSQTSHAEQSHGLDVNLKNPDLHGMAPDSCPVALLIIDMINDMEFPGGEVLYEQARPLADRVLALKSRCHRASIPTVYVNDNFGRWQSDFQSVVEHVRKDQKGGKYLRGRELAQVLQPGQDDYFVLKPKHSGFYSTTLDLLLKYLGSRTLILTGVAGDICVLFTANDAYMRVCASSTWWCRATASPPSSPSATRTRSRSWPRS